MLSLSVPLLIGRLLAMPGTPLPEAPSERSILFIKKQTFIDCTADAGVDAGTSDAGTTDGGMTDAGITDAGIPPDAAADAGTCTGLEVINTITMVVQPELGIIYPDSDFALLYVTPARPQVSTQPGDVFGELATATRPMIEKQIVYVEDPAVGQQCSSGCGGGQPQQQESGCGGGYESSSWDPPTYPDAGDDDGGLGVETVGPYEIVRAQPSDEQQLQSWLDQFGYAYQQEDLDAVAPYLALGYHVVAVRMRPSSSIGRRTTPLAFTWEGEEIRIPAALGHTLTQPLSQIPFTVYIAADGRYDIPQAVVPFAMQTSYGDARFLTRNEIILDDGLPATSDPIALATNNGEYRDTKTVTEEKHVPKTVYCDDGDDEYGLCSDCNSASPSHHRRQIDFGTIALAAIVALRRRKRRK